MYGSTSLVALPPCVCDEIFLGQDLFELYIHFCRIRRKSFSLETMTLFFTRAKATAGLDGVDELVQHSRYAVSHALIRFLQLVCN